MLIQQSHLTSQPLLKSFTPIPLALSLVSGLQANVDVNIRERGAAGDGQADDTASIQSAIDECGKASGGRVVKGPGVDARALPAWGEGKLYV